MFRTSTDETKKAKAHNTRWSQGVSHSIALFDFGDRTKTGIFSMVQRLFVALCATRSEGAIHLFISGIIASNGQAMAPSHEKRQRIRFPFPLPSSNTQLHEKEFVYTLISSWQRPTHIVKCIAELFGGRQGARQSPPCTPCSNHPVCVLCITMLFVWFP